MTHDAHAGRGDRTHGDHHTPSGPRESPWRITAPLVILASCAVFAGYLNAPAAPFKTEKFTEWVEPRGVVVPDAEATAMLTVGSTARRRATSPAEAAVEARTPMPKRHAPSEEAHGASGLRVRRSVRRRVLRAVASRTPSSSGRRRMPSILLVALGGFVSLWICIGIFGRERIVLKGLTTRFAPARWGHNFLVNKYYLDHLYEKVIVHGIAHPIATGRVLDQPARARRHRQRRRQGRPSLG